MPDAYTWAIVGVCASIGACVLALLVFVLIFCRTRLKEDSNVRKRIITKKAFPERPPTPEPEPEPEPDFYPVPVVLPPPPPQPRPLFIPRPIRLPPPQPPLPLPPPRPPQAPPPAPAPAPAQPNEPTIIIRTVYEEGNNQRPAERVVRRRSWAGDQDELVFVKKIRGRKSGRGYKKRKSDDSSSSSSSSSDSSDSDDDYQTRNKRRQNNAARPAMVPMGYVVPRLDPYDLAVPNYGPYSRGRPGVVNLGQLNTGPSFGQVGQPTILLPGTSGNQPGYVSVLMPQQ